MDGFIRLNNILSIIILQRSSKCNLHISILKEHRFNGIDG